MNAARKGGRILLVDDHELILNGLGQVLKNAFVSREIVGFSNALQACDEIKKEKSDLYIIDLQLKEMSGFELIDTIRKFDSDALIIVSTMHEEVWNINRLMEMDVDGIVLKSSAAEHIVQAVNTVLSGNRYLCPRFSRIQNRHISKHISGKKKQIALTPQEKLILQHIVNGDTTHRMAEKLFLSENTIETHRKNLFMKLDVHNVAQLVSIALRAGLVNDEFSICSNR
ncbi:response regulator [Proteiniphilum sp. UBA5384]|uniref:response regulator n=1 Tax=Proteiniphilum sp. UBA5384 TaxID=1947279 RepID=UPI0025E61568|nr:response regulator transcription factor [Proteiniphilum sp. UBA5384]